MNYVLETIIILNLFVDRAHLDDVEKEMDEYVTHTEEYVNALKLEIKARDNLITLLSQAETHLENDKKDVKLVTNVSNNSPFIKAVRFEHSVFCIFDYCLKLS